MGFIDDWSYVKTAFEYARTGHFVYNGWATAMLGWQVLWGAAFVKLFGYSFRAARMSMLPIDLFSIWLFYAILVRLNISRRSAVFGALTLGLSPLFIPLAASYMTDTGGLVVILLCFYLCIRALYAATDRAAFLWLATAAGTNVIGGTVRQIAWLGALVMVPSAAWLMRRRRWALMTGAALWSMSVLGIAMCLRWWSQQPYSVPEKIVQGPITGATVAHLAAELVRAVLCLLLILLPLLTAWLPRIRTLPASSRIGIIGCITCLVIGAYALHLYRELHFWTMPWLVHVLGSENIFEYSWDMLGRRPVTIPVWFQAAISIYVVGISLIFFADVRRLADPFAKHSGSSPQATWRFIGWLVGPFAAAYVVLLLSRGLYVFIYDRYLLGLMPFAIICLLKLYNENYAPRLPVLSYAVLAVFAAYGVLATHDLFALNRARIAAVQEVRSTGVPAKAIQAGFEYDGWTQINEAGYVNEKRMEVPQTAYKNDRRYLLRPHDCRLGFDEYAPALNRRYLVVLPSPNCGVPSTFPAVTYIGWLPPIHRAVYVYQVDPLPEAAHSPN
jgi:hypothetical protein